MHTIDTYLAWHMIHTIITFSKLNLIMHLEFINILMRIRTIEHDGGVYTLVSTFVYCKKNKHESSQIAVLNVI